jgi:cbb3-type cytochrome oxidase maturation protein
MSVLFVALPVALMLGFAALLGCLHCIRSGQFDDLESPSVRILIDDQVVKKNSSTKESP